MARTETKLAAAFCALMLAGTVGGLVLIGPTEEEVAARNARIEAWAARVEAERQREERLFAD